MLKRIILGFIIGVAAITPGLSGGMLAIVLGVYAPALDAALTLHHKQHFKKSFLYLLPLGIGVLLGVGIFSIIMKYLLQAYEQTVIYCFIGLIIGSLPSLYKEASEKGVKWQYFLFAIVAFALGCVLTFAMPSMGNSSSSPLTLSLAGIFLAMGTIIPGISSSFLLMQFGIYDNMINSLADFNICNLFWIGLGAVVFALASAKLINIAFKKFHGYAYFTAMGFLFSSIIGAFMEVSFPTPVDIPFFLAGLIGAYMFIKKASD